MKIKGELFLGLLLFLATVASGILLKNEKIVLLSFVSFPVSFLISKVIGKFMENKRIKSIENDLPGMLITASSASSFISEGNLLQFLIQNSKGELNKELRIALAQSVSGMPLNEALEKISERNKSELIARAMKLLSVGIESGNEMTETYLGAAEDFSEILRLEREKNAAIIMQKITIFAGCLIVPFIIANVVSVNQSIENTSKINLYLPSFIYVAEYCILSSFFLGALDGLWKKAFFYSIFLLPLGLMMFLGFSGN